MHRWILFLLGASVLVAQPGQQPQLTPLQAAEQSYQRAHREGRFADAAAAREQARQLLATMPTDDPMFPGAVQSIAQLYESAGRRATARALMQEALSRTAGLAEASPVRLGLLNQLANQFEQDRNLLKAVSYREQVVAGSEAAPPPSPPSGPQMRPGLVMSVTGANRYISYPYSGVSNFGAVSNFGQPYVYSQLANNYRQLGRPQDAAAVIARAAAHLKDDSFLASLYEQQGKLDEAAAIYKRLAQQASDPSQAIGPLQQLSNLYEREQHWADAEAALQQAIGSVESSGNPQGSNQSFWMRQNLARIYQSAGDLQAADHVYEQLLGNASDPNNSFQALMNYANSLSSTQRGAKAESLLKDYLASHSDLPVGQDSSILWNLAQAARSAGNPQQAKEYEDAARAKQPQPPAEVTGPIRIAGDLNKAQAAVNANNTEEAFRLTMQSIAAAPAAQDRDSIMQTAPYIATNLAFRKAPQLGDQIFQNLFQLAQDWSVDTIQPLLTLEQNYGRFLLQQQRWGDLDRQIERYRDAVVTADGAQSGSLEEVQRLVIDEARARQLPQAALAGARSLVELEESLSGTTSEPYLRATETLAGVLEWSGDPASALPLRKKMITIADLVFTSTNDQRRASIRMDTALALARQQQFEEADALAREAVAIAQRAQPRMPDMLTFQLAEIARIKKGEQPPSGTRFGVSGGVAGSMITGVLGVGPWAAPAPAPPPPPPVKK